MKYLVRNVTKDTYVSDYDEIGTVETRDINLAKRYKNFKKADKVASKLTNENKVYKAVELI